MPSTLEFNQSDAVRDFVFPLIELTPAGKNEVKASFLGSGFFIGEENLALTAAHVMRNVQAPAILMLEGTNWRQFAVLEYEEHPTEDVAMLRLSPPGEGRSWRSICTDHAQWAGSSLPYALWGYPEDAAREIVENGHAKVRPDLVYSEGHIRRRMTDIQLPGVKGRSFYELSGPAGAGFSGSPVFQKTASFDWNLIGVYVGERITDSHGGVGFAARVSDLSDWVPDLTGKTLRSVINSRSESR